MGASMHYRLPITAFRMQPARGIVVHRTGKWGMGPEIQGELVMLSQDRAGILWPRTEAEGSSLDLRFREIAGSREFVVTCKVRQVRPAGEDRHELVVDFDKRIPYLCVMSLARPRLL